MATEDPKHSEGEEEIALSHKLQRKLKRKRERGETDDATISKPKKAKTQTKDKEKTDAAVPIKRENSIWVGNLAYKTTAEDVRKFFDGVGEITRVNMPKGPIKGSATKRENSGYVALIFPDAQMLTGSIFSATHLLILPKMMRSRSPFPCLSRTCTDVDCSLKTVTSPSLRTLVVCELIRGFKVRISRAPSRPQPLFRPKESPSH